MSTNMPMDPAAAAASKAAANAFQQFVTEDFTLFAVGLVVTIMRTFARVKQVGFKGLLGDDYLVWVAMVCSALVNYLHYLYAWFFTKRSTPAIVNLRGRNSPCLFRRCCGHGTGQ